MSTDLYDMDGQAIDSHAMLEKVFGLVGEAGEVAEKFKKILRDKNGIASDEDKKELAKELGDVLWYINSVGVYLGFSLEDIAQNNLDKVLSRKERGVTQGSGDNEDVTFSCVWSGSTVYNARVTFHFSAGQLCLITGTRLFDTQSARVSLDNCPDGITVLMNFLQSVRSTGDVCTEIRSLELGYFMSSAVSGECTLRPVWCVETDSRAYYIDAETGKSETLDAAA